MRGVNVVRTSDEKLFHFQRAKQVQNLLEIKQLFALVTNEHEIPRHLRLRLKINR